MKTGASAPHARRGGACDAVTGAPLLIESKRFRVDVIDFMVGRVCHSSPSARSGSDNVAQEAPQSPTLFDHRRVSKAPCGAIGGSPGASMEGLKQEQAQNRRPF